MLPPLRPMSWVVAPRSEMPMTMPHDCPACNSRASTEEIAARPNPDGSVTVWFLCSCCRAITKVVGWTTDGARRAA